MPRRAKEVENGSKELRDARPATNGFSPDKLQGFIDRVQSCQAEIDAIMERAKDACLPHREDIAVIMKEAAEDGLPKREFSTVLRRLRLEDKVEHVADKLHDEQRETYDQMLHALGKLAADIGPLGQAALDAAQAGAAH
jgi:uncharacterized protein (UPF0335 family)